jgi:hypothetical protein
MVGISGSGNGRSKQTPTRSTGESLAAARHTFRIWRRTRPFWGGLVVIVGAGEILVSEQAPLRIVTHIGIQGLAGYLIPAFMLLCGALLWLNPIDRIIYSLLAIFLALGSWITSNLGGFFVGMLVGVVGGALAFGWTTEPEYGPLGLFHGKQRIALPPGRLVLIYRLNGHAAPQLEGPRGLTESAHPALPWAAEKKLGSLADDEAPSYGDQDLSSDQTAGDG